MLDALKGYNRQERALHLSRASQVLLPDPGLGTPKYLQGAADVDYEALLREAQEEAGVGSLSTASERTELLDYVNRMVRQWTLKDKDLSAIRERLGQRGDLDSRHYRIQIDSRVAKGIGGYGVRPAHAKRAVREYDQVQHLGYVGRSGDPSSVEENGCSLFVQHGPSSQKDFALLVHGLRSGNSITISGAWRLYYSEVNQEVSGPPIEWLRAFAQKYGAPFERPPGNGAYLIVDERTDIELRRVGPKGSRLAVALGLDPSLLADHSFFGGGHNPESRSSQIAIAYTVNTEKYRRDLQKHGGMTF